MILADSEHRPGDALVQARRSASRLDTLTQGGRTSLYQRKQVTSLFSNVAQAYMNMHRLDEAVRYARRAVELARSPDSARQDLAGGLSLLANALRQMGDLDAALQSITEARRIGEKATLANEDARVLGLYAILWRQGVILGDVDSISLDRPVDAIEPLQAAFDLVDRHASRDLNDATSRARVGTAARQLGAVLGQQDPERGLIVYDRGLMRQREIKVSVMARRQEARLLAQSSYLLRQLHRYREAKDRIDTAFELLRVTKDYPAAHVELGGEVDAVIRALADHQANTGQPERALEIYRDLLDKVMAAKPNPESDLGQANGLSRIYLAMARLYGKVGSADEAAKLNGRRLELWRVWDQKLPHNQFVLRQLAASPDRSR
jgi:tetratricopeptide (TPR) repeat protein